MTPQSAKAKGRALAQKIAGWLRHAGHMPEADVRVTPSGVNGPDIQLSSRAAERWPFAIECKKHASFAIYKHFDQAAATAGALTPVLVVEANRRNPLVVVDAAWFFSTFSNGAKNA